MGPSSHLRKEAGELEKVQRRAARRVCVFITNYIPVQYMMKRKINMNIPVYLVWCSS
jgi:hypothetical protein